MSKPPCKVFLLGYGGADNTGSEVRILTIISDVRAALGSDVQMTIGTVDRDKTARIVGEDANLKIVQLPYVFPVAVWRLTKSHDIVVLVEGSTFKDNWSNMLLYLFLWGAWTANYHGNRSVAYAVDAGRMSRFNRWLTRRVCNRMDLLITRTVAARDELRALGVSRDIAVTTDTAFQFGEEVKGPAVVPQVGLAPVEFHQWPVKFKLWGRKAHCYHWPYYFSWDQERLAKSAALVDAWVALARHIVEDRGWKVRLIAMEELDGEICRKILDRLPVETRRHVETSFAGEQAPQGIVEALRRLSYLVTSRYHACVLSMGGKVPQMALFHDERLITIYKEIGIDQHAINYKTADLKRSMISGFEAIVRNESAIRMQIDTRLRHYFMPRCLENRELLRHWHEKLGPIVAVAK